MQKARQRMAEILRIVPGSSLVVAPTDRDLADAGGRGAGLEESFGGGGYTARQRAALLQLAWDHVVLGARRPRVRVRAARQRRHPGLARPAAPRFDRYNELANGVLQQVSVPMPEVDLSALRETAYGPRRVVTPPTPPLQLESPLPRVVDLPHPPRTRRRLRPGSDGWNAAVHIFRRAS